MEQVLLRLKDMTIGSCPSTDTFDKNCMLKRLFVWPIEKLAHKY